ncbi:hypothetical protein HK102_005422 [Quaeritorhiza haematococci]|nr:hypothetical protein HK102_005422 [Quaeritorhiza haematococci]
MATPSASLATQRATPDEADLPADTDANLETTSGPTILKSLPAEPVNIVPETSREGTIVHSAESPILHKSVEATQADRIKEPRTHEDQEKAARFPGEADSIRGKLRVDSAGMAETLNEGEREVYDHKYHMGRRQLHREPPI